MHSGGDQPGDVLRDASGPTLRSRPPRIVRVDRAATGSCINVYIEAAPTQVTSAASSTAGSVRSGTAALPSRSSPPHNRITTVAIAPHRAPGAVLGDVLAPAPEVAEAQQASGVSGDRRRSLCGPSLNVNAARYRGQEHVPACRPGQRRRARPSRARQEPRWDAGIGQDLPGDVPVGGLGKPRSAPGKPGRTDSGLSDARAGIRRVHRRVHRRAPSRKRRQASRQPPRRTVAGHPSLPSIGGHDASNASCQTERPRRLRHNSPKQHPQGGDQPRHPQICADAWPIRRGSPQRGARLSRQGSDDALGGSHLTWLTCRHGLGTVLDGLHFTDLRATARILVTIERERAAQATNDLIRHDEDGGGQEMLHGVWYTTVELAQRLGVDASTVRRWRTARPAQGPPFVRLSSRLTLYSAEDVQSWLKSRRVDPRTAA